MCCTCSFFSYEISNVKQVAIIWVGYVAARVKLLIVVCRFILQENVWNGTVLLFTNTCSLNSSLSFLSVSSSHTSTHTPSSSKPDALVAQTSQHTGAVRTLDVNPFQPNLLASGASESEIFIWDLTNPSTPMSPGNKLHPLEDISGVAWNRQVS